MARWEHVPGDENAWYDAEAEEENARQYYRELEEEYGPGYLEELAEEEEYYDRITNWSDDEDDEWDWGDEDYADDDDY